MEASSSDEHFCYFSHAKSWSQHSLPELNQDVVHRVVMPPSVADRVVRAHQDSFEVSGGENLAKECRSIQGRKLWKELKLLSPEEKEEDYLFSREWE